MIKEKDKPKTQTMAASGIAPEPPKLSTGPDHTYLGILAKLPPFQMFIQEREPDPMVRDSARYAVDRSFASGAHYRDLIKEYEKWHSEKGLWPHETPYGRPR